jgi:uncharacterized protein (TIGR02145 family)
MKKLITLLALVLTLTTFAQAPQGFNYQATVRNSAGALIVNQNVNFKFNVMLNSATSLPIFSETHLAPTDDLGQVNLVIGQGTATVGTFSTINWGSGNYYLGIELNTGSGYVAMGTTQLMSVPYALYSGNSCATCLPTSGNIGDVLSWNGTSWISTPLNNINSPSVITTIATNVTSNSAVSGGTISNDGGNTIIAKGVCWSSSVNPTINNFYTNNGSGANSFTSIISNLTPGTNYYYRAYITNSSGTFYGSTYTLSIPATLPTVTTSPATNITYNSATSGGNVTNDGGSAITARGVCWCTCSAPTINDNHTTDGSGLGSFVSQLNNLGSNYDIYVRAYATNSQGTSYGETIYFITPPAVPAVITNTVTQITSSTAISGGVVEGFSISARGVCWSTSPNPTIALSTKTVNGSGIGFFNSTITGLTPSTTYFIRAYGTNSSGTAYGNEFSFTTQSIPSFPTGTIFCNNVITGVIDVTNPTTGKTWMDRNLGASQVATSSTDALAYGDLYQWGRRADGHQCRNSNTTTMLSSSDQPSNSNFIVAPTSPFDWRSPQNTNLWQGVSGLNNPCPIGYRLPTEIEFNAEALSWSSQNSAGAFASPLKLSMAGYRYLYDGSINSVGTGGSYWSSTISDTRSRGLGFVIGSSANIMNYYNRGSGASVRCIKN